MAKNSEAERQKRISYQSVLMIVVVVISIIVAGWTLVTVSTTSQVPSSDFVTLPNQPLSNKGDLVRFVGVTAISQKGVAVGVKGYLRTASGAPVSGATLYLTYFLDFSYRTQVITTDQNGYFQVYFPMNWTGWLPLTGIYFGDAQHQGLKQDFSVPGETN